MTVLMVYLEARLLNDRVVCDNFDHIMRVLALFQNLFQTILLKVRMSKSQRLRENKMSKTCV